MDYQKISIITCSFNQAEFLEEAINSVLGQGYANLEYIIIDGGSTDGSVDIIKKYERQLSYWVSEPDRGQSHALIKGFARATGKILGWLCSDDILEAGALQEVGQFFKENPQARVVYGDTTYIDKSGQIIRVKRLPRFHQWLWLTGNFIPQPSTFWSRELYDEVGGLEERFDVAMDLDLWQRFSRVAKIWHVEELWSRQRFYPEAKTWNLSFLGDNEKLLINSQGFRKPFNEVEQKLLRIGSRTLRLLIEEGLSIYFWLKGHNKMDRPPDNPFWGIGPGFFQFKSWSKLKNTKTQQPTAKI